MEDNIDFLKIVNECNQQQNIDLNINSQLDLLNAVLNGNITQLNVYKDIYEFDMMFYRLKDIIANLDSVELKNLICLIANKELDNNNDRQNWLVNIIDYAASIIPSIQADKPEIKVKLINHCNETGTINFSLIKNILEEKYIIKVIEGDDYDIIIDGIFGSQKIPENSAFKIFTIGESIPSKISGYNLSLGFDYLVHDNYIRYPIYYVLYGDFIDSKFHRETQCNPNNPYFAYFLVSNANYSEGAKARTQIFYELSSYKYVASAGKHLNNMRRILPSNESYTFFSQCKFIRAYENRVDYLEHMTEKVLNAYFSGSVSLYYSHPSVQEEINKGTIFSRQNFKSDKEIADYIIKIDQDDKLYCKIRNNSIVNDHRRDYKEIKHKDSIIKFNQINDITMPYDVVYIINLDRSVNRWNNISQKLDQIGLIYKRFSAIDGYTIGVEEFKINKRFYGKDIADKKIVMDNNTYYKIFCTSNSVEYDFAIIGKHRKLSAGELGIWCSNYMIWKDIVQNEYNNAIIFEDDFIPIKDDFVIKLNNFIKDLPSTYDLAYIDGWPKKDEVRVKLPSKEAVSYSVDAKGWFGAHAIMYSNNMVQKLASCKNFQRGIDDFLVMTTETTMNCFNKRAEAYISTENLLGIPRELLLKQSDIDVMGRLY